MEPVKEPHSSLLTSLGTRLSPCGGNLAWLPRDAHSERFGDPHMDSGRRNKHVYTILSALAWHLRFMTASVR